MRYPCGYSYSKEYPLNACSAKRADVLGEGTNECSGIIICEAADRPE